MELRKNDLITTYIVPIIGSVGSALDVIGDTGACISLLFLSLALGVVTALTWKKDKGLAKAVLCCVGILFVIPFSGLIINHTRQKDLDRLNSALVSSPREEFDLLRERAEEGDGPALYRLAEEYGTRREYSKSREYAREAADKGNPKAYMLLAEQHTLGLGCPVNYSRAIANILYALRYADVNYDYILRYMHERGYEVSEWDKEALDQAKEESDRLHELWTEVSRTHAEKGRDATLLLLNDNYQEIFKLSTKGYVHAIELLYIREFLKDPNPAENAYYLAQRLYKVDHIPTSPSARHDFFGNYYWDKQDSMAKGTDAIDRYIEDNDYFMYSMLEKADDGSRPLQDGLLVADYHFDRARYEWYKGILQGEVPRVDYAVRYRPSEEESFEEARTMLEKSIRLIYERIEAYMGQKCDY